MVEYEIKRMPWINVLAKGIDEANKKQDFDRVSRYAQSIQLLSAMEDDFIRRHIQNFLFDIREAKQRYGVVENA